MRNHKQTIRSCISKIDELRNSKLIGTKIKCYSYQEYIKKDQDNEFNIDTLKFPRDEYIESFLLRFRHFFINSSSVNFFKFFDSAYLLASNPDDKETIATSRKLFSHTLYGNLPKDISKMMGLEDFKNTDKIFKLFFNGKYFHIDDENLKKINKFSKDKEKISFYIFLTALYSITSMMFISVLIVKKTLKIT